VQAEVLRDLESPHREQLLHIGIELDRCRLDRIGGGGDNPTDPPGPAR